VGEIGLHAREFHRGTIGAASAGMAVEQLVVLCKRRRYSEDGSDVNQEKFQKRRGAHPLQETKAQRVGHPEFV